VGGQGEREAEQAYSRCRHVDNRPWFQIPAAAVEVHLDRDTRDRHNGRMRPPRGLDATGRAAWRHAVSTLIEIGEDPALSQDAIRRFASAHSMAAHLR
jgi:hypothetical protein